MGTRVLRKFKKINLKKFPIHPSFILLFLWFIIFKNFLSFVIFSLVVCSHELGHYFVARKLGYKLDYFYIAPYGVNLNYKEKIFGCKDEVLIALAGPLVNIFLSILCVALWWIFPPLYHNFYEFVFESMMLALINLLPCYPLDGGRIFVGVLSNNMPRKKAIKIVYSLNYIFSFIIFLLFIITAFIDFNPTLCLCASFLLLGAIDTKFESKYQPSILVKKDVKNFTKPYFTVVDENTPLNLLLKHIEPNRATIFVVRLESKTIFIDEKQVKEFLLKYPYSSPIKECIKQEKE